MWQQVNGMVLNGVVTPSSSYSSSSWFSWLSSSSSSPSSSVSSEASDQWGLVLGYICTLSYALITSVQAVLINILRRRLESKGQALSHLQISSTLGKYGSVCATAYLLFYTVPRWQNIVAIPVLKSGLSIYLLAIIGLCFGACCVLHSFTYWSVAVKLDPVSTGLANALRTATVFVASAALFCSAQRPLHCLSGLKVGTALLVLFGLVLFAHKSPKAPTDASSNTAKAVVSAAAA